jgi:hypothetical protein
MSRSNEMIRNNKKSLFGKRGIGDESIRSPFLQREDRNK